MQVCPLVVKPVDKEAEPPVLLTVNIDENVPVDLLIVWDPLPVKLTVKFAPPNVVFEFSAKLPVIEMVLAEPGLETVPTVKVKSETVQLLPRTNVLPVADLFTTTAEFKFVFVQVKVEALAELKVKEPERLRVPAEPSVKFVPVVTLVPTMVPLSVIEPVVETAAMRLAVQLVDKVKLPVEKP